MVLDVDEQKRRISLGLKQTMDNPWDSFQATFTPGTELEGEVKNITEFGLFVGLPGDIDGMVHLSDLDWNRPGEEALQDFNKGDMVKVKVLDVDVDKERISLGIKQLEDDPFAAAIAGVKKGDVVTCTITEVNDNGIEVSIADGATGFIRKADLSRERSEQRPDRFAVGEKVDAKVTNVDRKSRKLTLSIKAREIEEEKEAMESYGSSDSGASLGDILGAALSQQAKDTSKETAKETAKDAAKDEAEEKAPAKAKKAPAKAKTTKTTKAKKADDKAEEAAAEATEAKAGDEAGDEAGDDAEK